MRIRRPSLLLVAVVAVSACASPAPSGSAIPASSAPASSAPSAPGQSAAGSAMAPASPGASANVLVWLPEWADDSVPAEIANRRPIQFCGLEKAPGPSPGEFIDAAVRACFWDAWNAGREAEFASVQTTIEGDPIATIYRTLADGSIDMLADGSQDKFGSGGWTATTCSGLVEDTEGNALFGVEGCGEGVLIE